MDADRHGLLNEEETKRIIGCALEVLNCLGYAFLEKPLGASNMNHLWNHG